MVPARQRCRPQARTGAFPLIDKASELQCSLREAFSLWEKASRVSLLVGLASQMTALSLDWEAEAP